MKILPRHKKFLRFLRHSYEENKLSPNEFDFLTSRFLNEIRLEKPDECADGCTFWGNMIKIVRKVRKILPKK